MQDTSTKKKAELLTADKADSIINTDTALRLGTDFLQGAASNVRLDNTQRALVTALEATVNAAMDNLAIRNANSGTSDKKMAQSRVESEEALPLAQRPPVISESQQEDAGTVSKFFSNLLG